LVLIIVPFAGIAESQPPDPLEGRLELASDSSAPVQLGNPLRLAASGPLAESIAKELSSPAGTLTLYLDGVRMEKVPARRVSETADGLVFVFDLVRDAHDDVNRAAWDALLATQTDWTMQLNIAVGVGKAPARLVDVPTRVTFHVAAEKAIYTSLVIGLVILVAGLWLIVRFTTMLRDPGTGSYSLGKAQMAFWGLVVVLTFTGIWALTGDMERIPAQVLILLGISAGTGLSALLIGPDDQGKKAQNRQRLADAKTELNALKQRQAQNALSATEIAQLNALNGEIAALEKAIQAGQPGGFWRDIVNDGNGPSFHRVQVVIWTLVLGAVFVRSVLQTISMPEFPETLLVLMGISNATYLGFKTAEK
jgi:hypothetical protein